MVLGAYAINVAEHPEGDAGLGQGPEDGGGPLRDKEQPWRDLQVVAQFHVHSEVDALADHVRAENLKEHIGQGLSFEHVTADELAEDIELVGVDVGDSLDDAAGHHVEGWDDEGQENTVDGKLGFVDLDQYNGDSSHYHNYGSIPVPGSFPI